MRMFSPFNPISDSAAYRSLRNCVLLFSLTFAGVGDLFSAQTKYDLVSIQYHLIILIICAKKDKLYIFLVSFYYHHDGTTINMR
jgi:hypothetical protein